jgi:ATP-binding cassette subfamily B protein
MENIRMGNPAATDEQVMAAAKAAQCQDFVEKLPAGYHTVIGTRGIHLSGGEKQRIAIARAIVKDAPIVVLDEATAFSDPENEHLIQKAFEGLMKNKTVIMIAHRLSTVIGADRIIVIDRGRVVQSGTHEELLQQDGRYGDMWRVYTETASWRMAHPWRMDQPEKEGALHG